MKSLLKQDFNLPNTLKLEQSKMYKNLNQGNITILNQIYTLKVTDNKRKIIYNEGIFNNTEPYKIGNS